MLIMNRSSMTASEFERLSRPDEGLFIVLIVFVIRQRSNRTGYLSQLALRDCGWSCMHSLRSSGRYATATTCRIWAAFFSSSTRL